MEWHRLRQFEDAYDAAGILDEPPSALVQAARSADVLAASDLRRALESAQRLAPDKELKISPLLREFRLEPPDWIPVPLPIQMWDVMNHAQWSWRLFTRAEDETVKRAV